MALRTVGVRLQADVSAYMSGLKRAQMATTDFVGQLDASAKAGNLDAVADRAGIAGLALAGTAAAVVKLRMDFDKSMSAVSAATHASAADLKQLEAAAIEAGKNTTYSATEAANAITELSKAGVSTADVLGGGLDGALSLAAAGQMDVAEAAETAASAMTQFKLKGSDVPHIADLLAAAAGKAQGTVHDMGMALNQAGLVAAQTGLSIEDTTGTLAAFASAGLTGSDAGTSLKQMLLMLQAPAKSTKKLMDELGISAYDAEGQFVGITNLAQQLKDKLGKLTPEMRANAMATIFGADATRAASILYENGQAGLQGWIDKVNDSGYAAETAAKLTDNLAGDLERLKGSLETLAIESGGGASGGLRVLTKGLTELVDQFGNLPPAVGSSLTVLAGVGGITALALAGFLKLRSATASAVEQLTAMGPAGEKAGRGLQRASKAAGIAAAAFVGLEVVGAVFDKLGQASVKVDSLADSLVNYSKTGKVAGELSSVFGGDLEGLADSAQAAQAASHGFWGGLNDLVSTVPGVNSAVDSVNESLYGLSFNQATDNMAGFDEGLTKAMTSLNDARKASELWREALNKSGLSTEELAALLPNAYKKVGELNNAAMQGASATGQLADGTKAAGDAAGGAAGPTGDVAEKTKEYTSAAEAAADAAKGQAEAMTFLSDVAEAQANPVFGLLNAQKDLTEAHKEAAKAAKKYGGDSTEAKEANQKLALAAIDLQGKVGALGNTFDGKLSPSLRDTLRAAKLTDSQINAIERQFGEAKRAADAYSGTYKANVSAPGAVPAWKAVKELRYQVQNLKGKTINVVVKYSQTGRERVDLSGHRIGGYQATGGPVTGPGPKGIDSELRMLAPGEHVLTAREVDAMGGHGAVEAMRAAALAMPSQMTVTAPAPPVAQLMRPTGGTTSVQIIEHRHTFAGGVGELGQLFVKALRTSPGTTAQVKQQLGLTVS